jgi:DNA repair protein RadD
MILRPYQAAAQAAVYDYLRAHDDHPCVVIPTAGGKTPVLASICRDVVETWNGRALVLAHVKELLEQSAEKLRAMCRDLSFGIYSAGLNRRDTTQSVIVAGIQSVYKRACDFDAFDLIIVDEAHMIPAEGDGMYRRFLADAKVINPYVRVVGFTATPFRLKTGPICTPDGILNAVCFEVGIRELIRDGYLSPLVSQAGQTKVSTEGLHVRDGEFVADEVQVLMDKDELVNAACAEIIEKTRDRKSCLIFCAGVEHGRHVARVLAEKHSVECGFVCAETPSGERSELLECFRRGELKYLCNVNVLTTGFDAPNIDCVVLLRPTASTGLYYQMVGRGFRLHPGKANCLVLDFGGNVVRHGPIDQLQINVEERGNGEAPAKECPDCLALIATGYARCPQCGHVFPPREFRLHEARASETSVLAAKVTTTRSAVNDVLYSVHTKLGAPDGPKSMRVDYLVGRWTRKSEWVCFEHDGFARHKAEAWWRQRSPDPVPSTAQHAVDIANNGGLALTKAIVLRRVEGEKYERIIGYEIDELPEALPVWSEGSGEVPI